MSSVVNNFYLDAFEWRRWEDIGNNSHDTYSELVSYQSQFSRHTIPTEICIHGKYRKVRYVYSKYLDKVEKAKFIACSEDDPEGKLPPAFVKCF